MGSCLLSCICSGFPLLEETFIRDQKEKKCKETPPLCIFSHFITSNINNWISLELVNHLTKCCLLPCRRGANNGDGPEMNFPSGKIRWKVTQAGWTCPSLLLATTPEWRLGIMQLHVCVLTLVVFKVGFPSGTVWLFVHSWACKLVVMWWIFLFTLRSALTFQTEKYFLPLTSSVYCVSKVGLIGECREVPT